MDDPDLNYLVQSKSFDWIGKKVVLICTTTRKETGNLKSLVSGKDKKELHDR